MFADEGPALFDCKELMLQIPPYGIYTGDAEQVVQVDHVFHCHGEHTRHRYPDHMGYAIASADTDHESVVIRFKLFPFLVFNGGNDVFRGHLAGLQGGFDNLRNSLFIVQIPDDVAHQVNVGVID